MDGCKGEEGRMTEEEKLIKDSRLKHIEALKEMRDMMLNDENWENMKRLIEAVTAGAFALARLNKGDFGEVDDEVKE